MEDNNQEKIIEVQKEISDIDKLNVTEDLIRNNTIEFEYNGNKYRLLRPSFEQKYETNKKRGEIYISLLKDPKNMLERDLIKLYKERGIDVDEMDNKLRGFLHRRNDLLLQLGKAIGEKTTVKDLEVLKNEIKNINEEYQNLTLERTIMMDTSIETQVQIFTYTYLAYLITEKWVDGKDLGEGNKEPGLWMKGWSSFEDFRKESEDLINQLIWRVTLLNKDDMLRT